MQHMYKGKVLPYSLPSIGPGADPVYRQSFHGWLFKTSPAVGCHYFPPGLQSPSQPKNVTVLRPVPSYTAWWQRQIGVNDLLKVVTQLCLATVYLVINDDTKSPWILRAPRLSKTFLWHDSVLVDEIDKHLPLTTIIRWVAQQMLHQSAIGELTTTCCLDKHFQQIVYSFHLTYTLQVTNHQQLSTAVSDNVNRSFTSHSGQFHSQSLNDH